MAHVAAVHAVLKTSAPVATQDAPQNAPQGGDGDFAAVLASLTPQTQAPKTEPSETTPHVTQAQHAALKQAGPAPEIAKPAPKIVRRVAPSTQPVAAKTPVKAEAPIADKSKPQLAEDGGKDDREMPQVVAVRPVPVANMNLADTAAPEAAPEPARQIGSEAAPKIASPAREAAPDIASRADLPPKAASAAASSPDAASHAGEPKAAPAQPQAPGAKVAPEVVAKLVAEAKAAPAAMQKPAEKAIGKPDAKTQAVLAKAQVDVVAPDKAPLPDAAKLAPQKPFAPAQPAKPQADTAKREDAAVSATAAETDNAPPPADATVADDAPLPAQAVPQQQPSPAAAAPAPAPATAVAVPVHAQAAVVPQAIAAQVQAQAAPDPERQPDVALLAAQIAAKAGRGTKMFEIRLDPPELGRVEVHLTVGRDGKAEATLYADRPETVALLQRDSQNLERSLKDAGLELSNSSLNFSLKGEQRQGDGGGASKARSRSLPDAVVARSEAVNASLASQYSAPVDGRLDIRV